MTWKIRLNNRLTLEKLKALIYYDPKTGLFRWVVSPNPSRHPEWVHKIPGSKDKDGYTIIRIYKKRYKAHRLAWFYITGKWPKYQIDHKDTNKTNNRWRNLREATRFENMHNRKCTKLNTTGYKGVRLTSSGKYRAEIRNNGPKINLGSFKTAEEAYAAYCQAAKELHGEYHRIA